MIVIPAIDLKDGRCVRLYQGRADQETVYSEDPVEVARRWAEHGAAMIHVVDLDGAFDGLPRNLDIVRRIVEAVDTPIELGGGIRSLQAIEEVLKLGVHRAILGTVAVEDPGLVEAACRRFGGDRVLVGIDARDGQVAVQGWVDTTGQDAYEMALLMKRLGVQEIVFTDIAKDGTLEGPAFDSLERMTGTGLKVIASGGVATLDDLKRLRQLARKGVSGVIVGKALYTGDVDLGDAIRIVENR